MSVIRREMIGLKLVSTVRYVIYINDKKAEEAEAEVPWPTPEGLLTKLSPF